MFHPVNVRLLCGNAIVREGLSRILTENEFRVTQFSTISDALNNSVASLDDEGVSLLLVDASKDELDDNISLLLRAHFPSCHLVFLSDKFDLETMLKAFQQGAMSYILKEISCERLVATLRLVAVGERVLPPQLVDALDLRSYLADMPEAERPADAAGLSDREFQLLRWLIMGHPNKVISQRMDISESTVKVHVKSILRKLNVQNRTQAAIWAASHGVRSNNQINGARAISSYDDAPSQPPLLEYMARNSRLALPPKNPAPS